jgi:hypothetical protein
MAPRLLTILTRPTLPVELRRGLARLYFVAAICWMGWFGYEFYDAQRQYKSASMFFETDTITRNLGRPSPYDRAELAASVADQDKRRAIAVRALLSMLVGAPLGYFVTLWLIAGFRRDSP